MRCKLATFIILAAAVFSIFSFRQTFGAPQHDEKTFLQQSQKIVVLNFDDELRPPILFGKEGSPGLIEILESRFGVFIPAHFFVIGGDAERHPELVKILSQKGFLIENHTYGHDNLIELRKRKGDLAVLKNLRRTSETITKNTGRNPRYLRPPYWAIDKDTKQLIAAADTPEATLRIVTIGDPDINTLDYDDYEKRRPASVLAERIKRIIASREERGIYRHVLVFHGLPNTVEALKTIIPNLLKKNYRFGTLEDYFTSARAESRLKPTDILLVSLGEQPVKAAYLAIDHLYNQRKIEYIEQLIDNTELNAVVIDFKVGKPVTDEYMKNLVARFHKRGAYVIGRMVIFQDSFLARSRPDLAIKDKNGALCYSGRKEWRRFWVDMESSEVQNYNIRVAKDAIDIGFDEINFDYIRFPSDFKGSCAIRENIRYPVWNGNFLNEQERKESKYAVMRRFYEKLKNALKAHAASQGKNITLSIDVFGEVFLYGAEPGIGQKLSDIAEFFDAISPMPYPSHYKCGMFGVHDPNAHPYLTYQKTLAAGQKLLSAVASEAEIRPWIQDFSWSNIYDCGPFLTYGPPEVRAQIKAGEELGIHGFMLWNGGSNFTKGALRPKRN